MSVEHAPACGICGAQPRVALRHRATAVAMDDRQGTAGQVEHGTRR
ncbi:MAG: hypothetical protein M0R77_19790 [Gammaproteobacteria bacterium]|nr:hypothetical protein [Gammaproteobacteria bacterium]